MSAKDAKKTVWDDGRDAFKVKGALSVTNSATVVCARYRAAASSGGRAGAARGGVITARDVGGAPSLRSYAGGAKVLELSTEWEVLLGQTEAVNWLRSTPKKLTTMRYGGEWKLAGGNVDEGEAIFAAACRELSEEFLHPCGVTLPDGAGRHIRPFICKQTRPIRSRSNLIYNFIALADENPWLRDLDVDEANAQLAARRKRHKALLDSGEFWRLSDAEKEQVSPEVRELRWMSLRDALACSLSSMASELVCVNDYQRELFRRLGKTKRDPMMIAAATMFELEALPGPDAVRRWCAGVDLASLAREIQWLFDGMSDAEVRRAMARSTRSNPIGAVARRLRLPHAPPALRGEDVRPAPRL